MITTHCIALIEFAYLSLSNNWVRKVPVQYKKQGEGGFRFFEHPSNKIILVILFLDQQHDSEQSKGIKTDSLGAQAAEAGSQALMEAAESAGEPLMEAAESAGEPLMEAAEVVTRPQGEAEEVPRDSSCSSKQAATDEENESATGAEAGPEAGPDPIPAEAVCITPPPEPDPTSQAAEVNPSDGVISEDPSQQEPSSGQG